MAIKNSVFNTFLINILLIFKAGWRSYEVTTIQFQFSDVHASSVAVVYFLSRHNNNNKLTCSFDVHNRLRSAVTPDFCETCTTLTEHLFSGCATSLHLSH